MKECTYGWYPPAKDIWKNYRATPDSYEKECLYKHGKSKYNSQPGVATPIQPTQIQLEIPPQRSASPTRVLSSKPPRPPSSCSASMTRIRPAPRKAWTSYVPQTSLEPQPPSKTRDTATSSSHAGVDTRLPNSNPHRVQSAHSHRPRINVKHRPVKSAGVSRSSSSADSVQMKRSSSADSFRRSARRPLSCKSVDREQRQPHNRSHPSRSVERPTSCIHVPASPQYEERPDSGCHKEEELYMPAPPPSPPQQGHRVSPEPLRSGTTPEAEGEPMMYTVYENQLKEHGWRMQVHGDPLNLKTQCIPPRLSYTVEVPIPEVRGEGPRGHMENYDTNFYNTIPRRRATFDVAQDWISEVLHAKRMELQKRDGGIKYRYKNFSFVY